MLPTTANDLQPRNKQAIPLAPTTAQTSHVIKPNDDCHDQPTRQSTTPIWHSTQIITTQQPSNILLQAIHHVMQLEANKLATKSQWTGPFIDIEEVFFGVVHPVTKQTITQYWKLQQDPALKDPRVPAMSKELHHLAQEKPGVTKATNTSFFLSHDEIRHIPKD
jgi:hypothetical protein